MGDCGLPGQVNPHPATTGGYSAPPRAIGYVNSALPHRLRNQGDVQRYARTHGYHLVRMVVQDPGAAPYPEQLITLAQTLGVAAFIIPSTHHIGGDPAALCAVRDVITVDPEATYAQAVATDDGTSTLRSVD